jgi:tetratricopeptide (TPR) repeat protein
MRIRFSILPLVLVAATCFAQQPPAQQDQAPPKDQASDQKKDQSSDQKKDQASGQNQTPPKDQDKSTPPAAPEKKPSTADENPFPEDISKKAAQGDDAPAANPDNPPRSSDEKRPAYSSSRAGMQGSNGSDDRESNISDGAGGYILNPKLAAQDVKIGGFYLTAGDYKGAYARYKEATKVNPENADAVFGLAEAARGLKLNDEAADNYRVYLEAFPDGGKSKAARKALAELVPAAKK